MNDFENLVDRLKNEVLWLLVAFDVLSRRLEMLIERIPNLSRMAWVDEQLLMEALIQQIVLRLVRLDDKSKSKDEKLFRFVTKAAQSSQIDPVLIKEFKNAITNYRSDIGHLKNKHRNEYIVHLHKGQTSTPRIPQFPDGMVHCLAKAVEVVDLFNGGRVNYTFRPGSQEAVIELRIRIEKHLAT